MKSEQIYRVNPSLSISGNDPEFTVAYLNGRIKILKCDPLVLREVLDLADGARKLSDLTLKLSEDYPPEDVRHFLDTLIQTEVIIPKPEKTPAAPALTIALLGNGIQTSDLAKKIKNECSNLEFAHFESYNAWRTSLERGESHFLIVCPEEQPIDYFLQVNDTCLQFGIPFLPYYYNGRHILAGPTVIPGKTPCYGCLVEHRRSLMSEKSSIDLSLEHLLRLAESRAMAEEQFDSAIISLTAHHVVTEALRFCRGGEPLFLVKKQIQFFEEVVASPETITFQAITTCPSCSGMNRNNLRNEPVDAPLTEMTIRLEDKPVLYRQGGRRSLPYDETKQKIDGALNRAGLEVELKRLKTGALDSILFRYTAAIRGRYNTRIPFLIPEEIIQRGKGITEEQAYLSAAFEVFERICARYYGGVEMVRATYRDVKEVAFDLNAYIGNMAHEGTMDRFSEDLPIDWIWGYSLVHERPELVPASIAFLDETRFQGHFFDVSSGGLSAGATMEDAILQGLLEVVEHDALMIWQSNALAMPKLSLDTIHTSRISQILNAVREKGFQVIIRNYTTDFSIPVFRAWIVNERDFRFYATGGLGANLDPDIAIERSVSEAWQALVSTDEEKVRNYRCPVARNMAFSYYSLYSLHHFNRLEILSNGQNVDYSAFHNQATDCVAGDIRKVIAGIRRCIPGADVVVVDMTKPVFNIPVVRVIVGGGLQRFAEPSLSVSKRMFDLPVDMGFRKDRLTFKELFNGAFPH